jgi:shikimate kinase / 3-dehydroquinate synthase
MNIFLYGPPGTGKSTIGKILAHNLKLSFVDLDAVIEAGVDLSIAQIMEQKGESAFRDLETSALHETVGHASSVTPVVIALGGGALLREENRSFAEAHGRVVLLMAELPTLLERLKEDAGKRPLLAGNLSEKLPSLLEQRREHYASFALQIQIDEMTAEQCAAQIQIQLGHFHLSAMGDYDVIVDRVEQALAPHASAGVASQAYRLQNPVIVTDENVAKFHLHMIESFLRSSGFQPRSIVLPAGEDHKNLDTISHLWNSFLENGLDRKSTVIALGGGVIGDMTGFAASTYMRGVQWICIPTTLLSMVDASIGGKTGFDLPQGKNLIGSFYPPKLVLADPQLLNTLPHRELVSGMAEVVKHGIISDPELFRLCACGWDWLKNNLEQVIKRAMAVKIKVIEQDPYEKGVRAALNLGHTVGHAVELASGFELRHGEAISIGLVAEAKYAERIGIAEPGLSNTISGVLSGYGLPIKIPDDMPHEEILRAMRVDKKKDAKKVRFALPASIGQVKLVEVTDLESVLEK